MLSEQIDRLVEDICQEIKPSIEQIIRSKLNYFLTDIEAIKLQNSLTSTLEGIHDCGSEIDISQQKDYGSVISEPTIIHLQPEQYLKEAREAEERGIYDEALQKYDRAIEIDSNYAEAYFARAVLKEYSLHNYLNALADYNLAITLDPNYTNAYFYRARLHHKKLHNDSAALADYERVIAIDSNFDDAIKWRDFLINEKSSTKTIEDSMVEFHKETSERNQEKKTFPLYITDYNDRSKNFQDIYPGNFVDIDLENYQNGRAGSTEEIILVKNEKGNYYLFQYDREICLVPKQNFKIRGNKTSEVEELFECYDYQEDNYKNFVLVDPAIVISQGSGNNQAWRLSEKGSLKFA